MKTTCINEGFLYVKGIEKYNGTEEFWFKTKRDVRNYLKSLFICENKQQFEYIYFVYLNYKNELLFTHEFTSFCKHHVYVDLLAVKSYLKYFKPDVIFMAHNHPC